MVTWSHKAVLREKEWKKDTAAFEEACGHFIVGIRFEIMRLQMCLLILLTPIKIIFPFFLLFLSFISFFF